MLCTGNWLNDPLTPAGVMMSNSALVRTVLLDNGIRLTFHDCSNRYFGDFHRVLVVVSGTVDPDDSAPGGDLSSTGGGNSAVLFNRELERMGVTSDRLQETVGALIDGFLASARGYLERPDMPEQLRKKSLDGKSRHRSSLRSFLSGG